MTELTNQQLHSNYQNACEILWGLRERKDKTAEVLRPFAEDLVLKLEAEIRRRQQ